MRIDRFLFAVSLSACLVVPTAAQTVSAYYSNPEVLWRSGTTWSMHVYKMDWTPDDQSYSIAAVTGSDGWTPIGAAGNKLLWQRPWWTGHFPEMTIWTMN